MADIISNLPTDSSQPSRTEAAAMNMLFNQQLQPPPPPPPMRGGNRMMPGQQRENMKLKPPPSPPEKKKTWMEELSKALVGAALFIILSQSFITDLISTNVPQFSSPFMSIILKGFAFFILFYAYEKLLAV